MTPEEFINLKVGDEVIWPDGSERGQVIETASLTKVYVRWQRTGVGSIALGTAARKTLWVVGRGFAARCLAS